MNESKKDVKHISQIYNTIGIMGSDVEQNINIYISRLWNTTFATNMTTNISKIPHSSIVYLNSKQH